jgi:DNA-binding transcriptional LysR family regulator
LSRLRQAFDDPLFVRTPGGMQPTPVADNVIQDVRHALELLQRSVVDSAQFEPLHCERMFSLGMNDLAQALLLPALHQRFVVAAPEAGISSFYSVRERMSDELKAGSLDLLLDAALVNAKELHQQSLGELHYVVAMRKGHPLVRRKMSLANYLSQGHIHVSSRRKGRGQMDIALHGLGERRKISMRVPSYTLAAQLAAETDLLWTVPLALAQRLPLAIRDLPFDTPPLQWLLYWSRAADANPANQWLREQVISTVDDILHTC